MKRRDRTVSGVRVKVMALSHVAVGLAAFQEPRMASAQHPAANLAPASTVTADRLVRMSAAELDALYRSASPGPVPHGKVRGIPIVSPGSTFGPVMSRGARIVWQGKVFRDDGTGAVNRFFGLRMIRGNVSYGPSWLDARPSLILDYQGTSLVYGRYRDEIRQVAPGLYLGLMFSRTEPTPTFSRYFAFEGQP
jgi:hypothetical protein